MKNIIAFSGSNSNKSINQQLLAAAIKKIPNEDLQLVKLTDYAIPIYSQAIEESGIPGPVKELYHLFCQADGFVLASPEHNGLPTAFLKNIIDWLSRIDQRFFGRKPLLLLSTSEGASGGASHLEVLCNLMPRWGAELSGTYSLGEFNKNFDVINQSITAQIENLKLSAAIHNFTNMSTLLQMNN